MKITGINIIDNILKISHSEESLTLLYSENCPYCRKFLPIWEESKQKYNNQYKFNFVDCDKSDDVSNKYNFRGLPTIIKYQNDKEIDRTEGYQPYENFKLFLDKIYKINKETEKIKTENKYKLLFLYSESCGFCTKFIPIVNEFQTMFKLPIERVSCLSNGDVCKKHNIKGVPSLILYDGDSIINNTAGFMNLENMISFIKSSILDLSYYRIDNDKKEDKNIITKKKIVSYINPSCPFCKKFEPVWTEAKEKYSNYFLFENINCSNNRIMCKNIQGVPTTNIMENDNMIDQQIGFIPFDNFRQKLEKHFKKYTISIIINQYCDFSKKMLEHFNKFKNKYENILNYVIIDNTFENKFKLDFFIDTYPVVYIHTEKDIIRKNIGYFDYDEFKNWILFE